MDYHRIYAEFIVDRKEREAGLSGYTESHHIIPRAHGGGDEPDNLIRLSPEDHFFAHLCWAKAVDTLEAWSAVMVMHERDRRSDIFKRKARERYGWARRRYGQWCSEVRRGEANPNHKPELITLKHHDGRVLDLTRSQWLDNHGIAHAALCGLIAGKNQSHYGWMLPSTNPAHTGRGYAGQRKRTQTKFHWRHIDGREAHLTPFDLAEVNGFDSSAATAVARGEHGICYGWYIKGNVVGWPSGRKHFTDDRVHVFVNVDGRRMAGTQRQLIASGLAQQDVSALATGDRKSAYGWMREDTALSGYKPRAWTRRSAA